MAKRKQRTDGNDPPHNDDAASFKQWLKAEHEREAERHRRDDESRQQDRSINKLLAIVGIAGIFVAAYSAWIAKQSADAAVEGLKQSRDAVRLERRAWLGIRNANVMRFAPGEPALAQLHIVNNGQTPAVDTLIVGRAFFEQAEVTPREPHTIEPGDRTVMTVWPNQVVTTFAKTGTLNPEQLSVVAAGQVRLYVTGTLFYRDVLQPPNRGHRTNFCYFIGKDEWELFKLNTDRERQGIVMVGCNGGDAVISDIVWPPANSQKPSHG